MGTRDEKIEGVEVQVMGRTRRRFSADEKQRMLDESVHPGESISSVARRHGVAPSLMFKWKRVRDEGAMSGLGADERVVAESEVKGLRSQLRELQRLLGQKTQEVEILRDALRVAQEKKLLLRAPLPPKAGTR